MNPQTVCISVDGNLAAIECFLARRGTFDVNLRSLCVCRFDLNRTVQARQLDPCTRRELVSLAYLLAHVARIVVRNQPAQFRHSAAGRGTNHHASEAGKNHQDDENHYTFHVSCLKKG